MTMLGVEGGFKVIYIAVNYVLYLINVAEILLLEAIMLTPKNGSVAKAVLRQQLILLPVITVKFFLTPDLFGYNMLLVCISIAINIMTLHAFFKERLQADVFALCIAVIGMAVFYRLACSIVIKDITSAGNDKIEKVIAYIVCAVAFVVYGVIVNTVFDFIRNRYRIGFVHICIILFLVCIMLYYIAVASYMLQSFYGSAGETKWLHIIACASGFFMIFYFIAICGLFRKKEERSQLKHLQELSLAWENEKENYEVMLMQIERMEKIRHDFYGQLAAARHIMTLDRVRGIAMIEELRGNLAQKKTGEKTQ